MRRKPKNKAFYFASKILQRGKFENVSKTAMVNRLITMGLLKGIPYQTMYKKEIK